MTGPYDHAVIIKVTFQGKGNRKAATCSLVSAIIDGLRSTLLIGSPSLDELEYVVNDETIELRSLGIQIAGYKQHTRSSRGPVTMLSEPLNLCGGCNFDMWIPTNAERY